MSDGCATYAHWPLHVWVTSVELARALNELTDVEARVVGPDGELPEDAKQVEVIVPGWPHGRDRFAEMVSATPKLRLVQATSAGVDSLLDLVPPDVRICDGRGLYDAQMAEWVLAGILAMVRDIPRYAVQQQAQLWEPVRSHELSGSRVLIVGYGAIGAAVEQRLLPFGVTVERVARTARDGGQSLDALRGLLPDADAVVLLVPLTADTSGLVDKEFLAAMQDGALFVNGSRGAVVDTDALVAELTSGRLRAVLDVTDPEPLPEGHPLWSAPNTLITPHVGGQTIELLERISPFVSAQVERYRDGRPLENVVTDGY